MAGQRRKWVYFGQSGISEHWTIEKFGNARQGKLSYGLSVTTERARFEFWWIVFI